MTDAKSFQCPNCGSSVSPSGSAKEVKCAYCGTTVVVPPELRDQQPPPHSVDFNYGQTLQTDDQILKTIGDVGKVTMGVTAGVTAVSVILPIALTCIILGVVGFIMYTVFSGIKSSNMLSGVITDVPVVFTQAPTDVPTLAPTPFDTPVPFTKILLKDNFTNPSSGWSRTHTSTYTLEYKNGNYHALVNEKDGGKVVYLGKQYTDTSIEVGIQQTAGPNDGKFGVACRATDSGGLYSFEISQDGSYGIYKYTNWNSDVMDEGTLDPNTILQGKINHLEGICKGDTLTLLVNNQPLLQVQDSDYTSGGVGLIARTGGSGDPGIDVQFSNYLVKGP